MINNLNFKTSTSLNDAFELILKIFTEERDYYESTIISLKDKITELEDSLLQAQKENMSYQSRITKLKDKLTSISKTVSKLEDSEFEVKIDNIKKTEDKNEINNYQYNTIKYRNTDTINSFRKKSRIVQEINKSSNIINNNENSNYLKMNLLNNTKLKNEEDINRNYIKKIHKKTLSTKIKNSILNMNHNQTHNHQVKTKRKKNEEKMVRSHCYNDEDVSFFLNEVNQNKMTVPVEKENQRSENRKKYIGRDKFNKIEQKIKGLKSALSIYNKQENFNSNENNENFPNDVNVQNINSKSSPYII